MKTLYNLVAILVIGVGVGVVTVCFILMSNSQNIHNQQLERQIKLGEELDSVTQNLFTRLYD